MEHKLIQKIDAEQKKLDLNAMTAMCQALGFAKETQLDIIRHYEWLLTLQLIQKNVEKTAHMTKQHAYAKKNYLTSLERAIEKHPLKLADWTKAGQAMERVFQEAYTKTR